MTEDEAIRWLALFGSAARPASKLVSNEIQSLVFGGLGFLEFGTCLLFDLPDDVGAAPDVARDGESGHRVQRRTPAASDRHAVVTLALGARGLKRLGLPEQGLATFPFAFLDGMTTPARARILGDFEKNAAENWIWGRTPAGRCAPDLWKHAGRCRRPGRGSDRRGDDLGMAPPHEFRSRR